MDISFIHCVPAISLSITGRVLDKEKKDVDEDGAPNEQEIIDNPGEDYLKELDEMINEDNYMYHKKEEMHEQRELLEHCFPGNASKVDAWLELFVLWM